MKSKKTALRPNLILFFCAAVFLITTGSMLVIGAIFVFLIHMGLFIRPRPFFLFLAIAVSSILISTLLARLIGEKIFAPIKELNHATKQIADGNFRVSIKEEGTVAEVREMAHNFNRMAEELRRTEITTMISRAMFPMSSKHLFLPLRDMPLSCRVPGCRKKSVWSMLPVSSQEPNGSPQ